MRLFVNVLVGALLATAAWQLALDNVPWIYGWPLGASVALALKVALGWLLGNWPQRWRWLGAIAVINLLVIPVVVLIQAGWFIVLYLYFEPWPWPMAPLLLLWTLVAIGLSTAIATLIDTLGLRSLKTPLGLHLSPSLGLKMMAINAIVIALGSLVPEFPWRGFWL